jgi:hypothetical protein
MDTGSAIHDPEHVAAFAYGLGQVLAVRRRVVRHGFAHECKDPISEQGRVGGANQPGVTGSARIARRGVERMDPLRDRCEKLDPERGSAIDEVLRRRIRADHARIVEIDGCLGEHARLRLVHVAEDDRTVRPLHRALAGRAERPLPDIDARIGDEPSENEQNEIVPRLIHLQRRQVIFDEIARLHAFTRRRL